MSAQTYLVIAGFLLFCALLGCIGVVILMRASNVRRRIPGRRGSGVSNTRRSPRNEQRSSVIEARSRFGKHPEESSQGGWRA